MKQQSVTGRIVRNVNRVLEVIPRTMNKDAEVISLDFKKPRKRKKAAAKSRGGRKTMKGTERNRRVTTTSTRTKTTVSRKPAARKAKAKKGNARKGRVIQERFTKSRSSRTIKRAA